MHAVLLQCSGFWLVFDLTDHAVFNGRVLHDIACLDGVLHTDFFLFLDLLSRTRLLHIVVVSLVLTRVCVFLLMSLFYSSTWSHLKFFLKGILLSLLLCAGLSLMLFVMVGADYLLQGRSLTVNLLYL